MPQAHVPGGEPCARRPVRGLTSAQETVPENVAYVTALPLHAGAVKYFFKERGMAVPAKALPPECRP